MDLVQLAKANEHTLNHIKEEVLRDLKNSNQRSDLPSIFNTVEDRFGRAAALLVKVMIADELNNQKEEVVC